MTKLKKIWESKWHILEGIMNSLVIWISPGKSKRVKSRREICSVCIHYDKNGSGPNAAIEGKPACGICGCNIKLLTACLSCECSLTDIGEEPKWK